MTPAMLNRAHKLAEILTEAIAIQIFVVNRPETSKPTFEQTVRYITVTTDLIKAIESDKNSKEMLAACHRNMEQLRACIEALRGGIERK